MNRRAPNKTNPTSPVAKASDVASGIIPCVLGRSGQQTLAPAALTLSRSPLALGVEGIRRFAGEIGRARWIDVLGVDSDATPGAIRASYSALAEIWSPVTLPRELSRARGDVEFIAAHIENAYRMLSSADDAFATPARASERGTAPTRMLRGAGEKPVDPRDRGSR